MILENELAHYAQRRKWFYFLPFILLFSYFLYKYATVPAYSSFFDGLNFGIHELGHVLFGWGNQFIAIAGGTLAQVLFPLAALVFFIYHEEFFEISFCLGWLGTNCFHIAVYVADARLQQLPLVGISGGKTIHDWNYLLFHMKMLSFDTTIATVIRCLGYALLSLAIISGIYIMFVMAGFSKKSQEVI